MKHNKILYLLLPFLILTPVVSFAALGGVKDLLRDFVGILDQIKTIIFALALVYFFWGMAQFILHAGDVKTHEEGKNKMIWGIIILFVMVSIWGIVSWFGDTIGIPVSRNPIESNFAPCSEREDYYKSMNCPEYLN